MKRIFTLLPTFLFLALCSTRAAIHVVNVSDFQFSPSNIPNVVVGDVIRWNWINGGHTTTSISVPAGASPWNSPMNSGNQQFDYTVTVAGNYQYECLPHSPSMAGSFTASNPMPVRLTEFKLITKNNQPVLTWKTLTEENTDYFSARRSYDGTRYTEAGRIEAAGNSTAELNYTFTDHAFDTKSKYIYYMIAITDKDGKVQYSPVRAFKNVIAKQKIITSLSPNPISQPGHLMLKFNADKPGTLQVRLLNMQGKQVIKAEMEAETGINNGHLHLGNIPPGTYNLVCTIGGTTETHKIVYR